MPAAPSAAADPAAATIALARQMNTLALAEQAQRAQTPVLAELSARGYTALYVSPGAPLIYVELPKSEILALAQRDDIDTIYGPNDYQDTMESARTTQKASVVNTWGYNGAGIEVAILEDSRVQFSNPYLSGVTRVPTDTNVDDHATATAGMVGSTHATVRGIAPGVSLYSANATTYSDANLSAAMDWAAITQNNDVINNSWGGNAATTTLNVHDRHLDYIVRNMWSTVTVAAGNEANGCGSGTARVTSPARGYNVISVGNYADQNTLTWDDDAMNGCSSYVNPFTNIEKPEVAAVGSSITSTITATPWIANVGSGTSYAAPMVAGQAALLMQRNAFLQVRPEAVKAIIMATALNNIEGNSRLSDRDGAGGVDMRAAFHLVDKGWWDWNAYTAATLPVTYTVFASQGQRVRAAIAWDSNPSADYSTDPLQADIDLSVRDASGAVIATSNSIYNSYEIVEFTAPASGNYSLRIADFAFSGAQEYIGIAWWLGHRLLSADVQQSFTTPPRSHEYFVFDAEPGWNAAGIRMPAGANYDMTFYSSSAFDDPADYILREDSTTSMPVDFIVVDANHAPAGNYYTEIYTVTGSGSYPIEFVTSTQTLVSPGRYGPYTLSSSEVLQLWQIDFAANQRHRVRLVPTSGSADVGLKLFDSDPATSTTWYQGRSQAVVTVDSFGGGQGETLVYQNTGSTDRMALVVYKNDANSLTFYIEVGERAYLPIALKP
ncbi:MAG: S8/S53 family peptidase [Anaerolineae bacterium]|nr:S8/S53 family peptidase [Thermoflexales bacterium]MDW8406541.1 S8/S53 family peptidase [Anaerolineae bacterium]